tara:strand:+ start:8765 stop:9046 length:282 start_codon:yes stop_codon:yes gene_type:complete
MPGEEELFNGLFKGLVGQTKSEFEAKLKEGEPDGPGMTSGEATVESDKLGANAKASAMAIITFINEVLELSDTGALTVNLPEIPADWVTEEAE